MQQQQKSSTSSSVSAGSSSPTFFPPSSRSWVEYIFSRTEKVGIMSGKKNSPPLVLDRVHSGCIPGPQQSVRGVLIDAKTTRWQTPWKKTLNNCSAESNWIIFATLIEGWHGWIQLSQWSIKYKVWSMKMDRDLAHTSVELGWASEVQFCCAAFPPFSNLCTL